MSGLPIIGGFDNRSPMPLDANYIVANVAALALLRFKHAGMWRWVSAEQNVYLLKNDLTTWYPLVTGNGIQTWTAGTYQIGELVISAGGLYQSQEDNNTSTPGADSKWLLILAAKGEKGDAGTPGKSAYQLWLDNGNEGDIEDFLASLKGNKGDKGDTGNTGMDGPGLTVWDPAIASDEGYDGGVMVRYNGRFYESLAVSNHSEPGTDGNWEIFDPPLEINDSDPSTTEVYSSQKVEDLLADKVDKITGYQLSQENFTTSQKDKLDNLSEHFKGKYTTLSALTTANPTGNLGDYAFVDAGVGHDAKMYIWDGDDNTWVLSSGSIIPDATETAPGLIELATVAEALARTDDQRAMTALKTIALILDEMKNVDRQIAPIGVNEVSFLMKNSGNVLSSLISGASTLKLKTGTSGTYPTGSQTYPFAYTAGDRVFATYNYTDLANASCNIILTCRDN